MNTFMIDGEVVRILDPNTAVGCSKINRAPSLAQRAKDELKEVSPEEKESLFLAIYFESGLTWHTVDPEDILRLSLAGQTYICSHWKKRMTPANALLVYYRTEGRFVPLYKVSHFETKKEYTFLNKVELTQHLLKVFKSVKLTLGQLSSPGLESIAWKAEANEGDFFIPWHNGCIIPAQEHLHFEEKPLNEMRNVYSSLRFTSYDAEHYVILCC